MRFYFFDPPCSRVGGMREALASSPTPAASPPDRGRCGTARCRRAPGLHCRSWLSNHRKQRGVYIPVPRCATSCKCTDRGPLGAAGGEIQQHAWELNKPVCHVHPRPPRSLSKAWLLWDSPWRRLYRARGSRPSWTTLLSLHLSTLPLAYTPARALSQWRQHTQNRLTRSAATARRKQRATGTDASRSFVEPVPLPRALGLERTHNDLGAPSKGR